MWQGGHVAKQMASSNALAGLGSHLKLSLYRLRSLQNEGEPVLRLYKSVSRKLELKLKLLLASVWGTRSLFTDLF